MSLVFSSIQSLCFFIGEFSLFTFKVIIDRHVLTAFLLIACCSSSLFLFSFFPCGLMTFCGVTFICLSHLLCRFLLCGYHKFHYTTAYVYI